MNRITLTLAAITALAGAPVMAQSAGQPAAEPPKTAPGVEVDRIFDLQVGDRAPELAIQEWIKGEPVTGFEKGQVYVVEFWATWCGPCVASMPHISELQKKYKDKGVRIIGVQIWEETDKARPFVEEGKGADRTNYTIAVEEKIDGEDPAETGEMVKAWMKPAGRNGIPAAFLINQEGYVAWIGHPVRLDKPLEQVVAGEWDLQEAAAGHVTEIRLQKTMMDFRTAAQSGDAKEALEIAGTIIKNERAWDNAGTLNMVAWMFVDPDGTLNSADPELALKTAKRAVELSNNEDGMIMDTLAWALFHAGKIDEALKTEQKAIDLAPEGARAQLQEALDKMKAMAEKKGDG